MRIGTGVAAGAAASYLLLALLAGRSYPLAVLVAAMAALGLAIAALVRSWWTVVAIPFGIAGASAFWDAVGCRDCASSREDTAITVLVLSLIFYGGAAAIGAAAGTLIGKQLGR